MKLTELQQQWIGALKSGEYTQTTGVLQNSEGYCCLGVACRVADKSYDVQLAVYNSNFYYNILFGSDLDNQPKVQELLGLKHSFGRTTVLYEKLLEDAIPESIRTKVKIVLNDSDLPQMVCLADLNDCFELTFFEIAYVLETYPQWFFNEETV